MEQQLHKWVCINCAKVRKGNTHKANKAREKCSLSSRIMVEANPTHHMHSMFGDRNRIPYIFCCKCGCYAQVRSEGLKNICHKVAYHTTIRSRLREALHPRTKEGLHGMCKVLCLQQMAEQWPSVHGGGYEGSISDTEAGPTGSALIGSAQAQGSQVSHHPQAPDVKEDPEVDAFFDFPWGLDKVVVPPRPVVGLTPRHW